MDFFNKIPMVYGSISDEGLYTANSPDSPITPTYLIPRKILVIGTGADGINGVQTINSDPAAGGRLDLNKVKAYYGNPYEEKTEISSVAFSDAGSPYRLSTNGVDIQSAISKSIKAISDQGIASLSVMRLDNQTSTILPTQYILTPTAVSLLPTSDSIVNIVDEAAKYNKEFIGNLFVAKLDVSGDSRTLALYKSAGSAVGTSVVNESTEMFNCTISDNEVVESAGDYVITARSYTVEDINGIQETLDLSSATDMSLGVRLLVTTNGDVSVPYAGVPYISYKIGTMEYRKIITKIENLDLSTIVSSAVNSVINTPISDKSAMLNDFFGIEVNLTKLFSNITATTYHGLTYKYKPNNVILKEDIDRVFSTLLAYPDLYYIVIADDVVRAKVNVSGIEKTLYEYISGLVNTYYDDEQREMIIYAGTNDISVISGMKNRHFVMHTQYAQYNWIGNPNFEQLTCSKYAVKIEGPEVLAATSAGLDKKYRDQTGYLSESTMNQELVEVKKITDASGQVKEGFIKLYNKNNISAGSIYTRPELVALTNEGIFAFKENSSTSRVTVVRDLAFTTVTEDPALMYVSVKINSDVTRQRLRDALSPYIGKRANTSMKELILSEATSLLRKNRYDDRMYEPIDGKLNDGYKVIFDEESMAKVGRQYGYIKLIVTIAPPFSIQEIALNVVVE